MKDFNDIHPHLSAIDKIDGHVGANAYDRSKAVSSLVCHIVDELIAGRPAPGVPNAERFTRIEGLVPRLADELVEYHALAIAHRTHLADALEKDGGENGAKSAAILRGMNPAQDFTGHQARGEASDEVEAPSAPACGGATESLRINQLLARPADFSATPNDGSYTGLLLALLEKRERQISEAEKSGFYQARNQSLGIVLTAWSALDAGRAKEALGAVSQAITMMEKEGVA